MENELGNLRDRNRQDAEDIDKLNHANELKSRESADLTAQTIENMIADIAVELMTEHGMDIDEAESQAEQIIAQQLKDDPMSIVEPAGEEVYLEIASEIADAEGISVQQVIEDMVMAQALAVEE